jgi:uncharacterized membrane protein YbaN (DUF454 family)
MFLSIHIQVPTPPSNWKTKWLGPYIAKFLLHQTVEKIPMLILILYMAPDIQFFNWVVECELRYVWTETFSFSIVSKIVCTLNLVFVFSQRFESSNWKTKWLGPYIAKFLLYQTVEKIPMLILILLSYLCVVCEWIFCDIHICCDSQRMSCVYFTQ